MKCRFSRLPSAAWFAFACLISPAFADTPLAAYDICVLTWAPSTSNEDGSDLTDLSGYYVYVGTSPDNLYPYGFAPAYSQTVTFPFPTYTGAHYFAVTAVNVDGVESAQDANSEPVVQSG